VLPLRGLGKGRLAGTARGRLGSRWTGLLTAAFAGTNANLDGTIGLEGSSSGEPEFPTLSGELKVVSGDTVPLLQLLALTPPDLTARLPVDVAARLDWSPAAWRIDQLAGSIGGGRISGELSRPANGAAVSGMLAMDRLPMRTILRTILGPEQPTRAGSFWSSSQFGRPLAEPPRLELDLRGSRLDLSDAISGSDSSLHLSLGPGALGLDRVSMRLANGRLDGSLSLRREEDNVALSGRLGFDGVRIERPAFGAAVNGSVEIVSSGRSEAALAAGLAGSGQIGLGDIRVHGLDPAALPRVAALAEDEKIEVDPKVIDSTLARELDRAPFRSNSAVHYEAAIAGGVLRLSPLAGYSIAPTLTKLQPAFDSRDFELNLQAEISLTSAPRGWTGPPPQISVAWVKLLSQPVRRVDSSALIAGLAARAAQREADHIQALEFDIKERAFFNRRLKWDRARQEERDRAVAEQAHAEQERIEQERRAEQERREQERRADQERRAAVDAEAARRRAESAPAAPLPPTNPFLRAQPAPAPGLVAPRFRAPAADQDPSAAGRY
jgi:hypothetical protein